MLGKLVLSEVFDGVDLPFFSPWVEWLLVEWLVLPLMGLGNLLMVLPLVE